MTSTTSLIDTRRPFRRADAIRAGIAPAELRGVGFRRIFRGVYVDAMVVPSPRQRVEAALVAFHPSAFASHVSAARVHAVPIPTFPDEHVSVLDPRHRRSRSGIRCHLAADPGVQTVAGLRVSTPARMFAELGSLLGLVDLVAVGDHLVRRGQLRYAGLGEICAASGLPGANPARIAAGHVRDRVDSPMETRLRMLLVLAGLPEPAINLTVRTAVGEPIRRYDLCYPEAKLVIEYDGRHHVEHEHAWESDLARREAIEDDGWRILVITAKDIYRTPGQTVQRVWRLVRARRLAGVPARLGDNWRPHFPDRR